MIAEPRSKRPEVEGPSKKKSRKVTQTLQDEEERLAAILFGGGSVSGSALARFGREVADKEEGALFEIDVKGDAVEYNEPTDLLVGEDTPAWTDDGSSKNVKIDLLSQSRLRKLRTHRNEDVSNVDGDDLEDRLRRQFENSAHRVARTDWARTKEDLKDDHSIAEDDESSLENNLLSKSSNRRLPSNRINMMRLPDANLSEPNSAAVQAVNFHPDSDPDSPLLLTAGLDKTLRFFKVNSEKSEKVHGIHFPKLPIYSAAFVGSSGNVVVSGRRPFFYLYDSINGKLDTIPGIVGREERSLERFSSSPDSSTVAFMGNDGYIILYSIKEREWIANLKINGSVRAITFSPDGENLLASGGDGIVYRWSMRTRKCVEKFPNRDGTVTSCLSSSGSHVAVGAESGVVNIYSGTENGPETSNSRVPLRTVMNLKTSIDCMRFNDDGQILALSSRREKDGLRLLHVPSGTVFSNWPTSKTPLNYVWSLDISPGSKFMAIGNDKGRCLLYKMAHYAS